MSNKKEYITPRIETSEDLILSKVRLVNSLDALEESCNHFLHWGLEERITGLERISEGVKLLMCGYLRLRDHVSLDHQREIDLILSKLTDFINYLNSKIQ